MYRTQKSMYKMITDSALDPVPGVERPMLIEDIQTCICAMQTTIWKVCISSECPVTTVLQKDSLRRQLDNLKTSLDHMLSQFSENAEFGQEKSLPLRYYFGYEDTSQVSIVSEIRDISV